MAHKTLIGGTAYGIKGGKTMISSTNYKITKGKALINGTGYNISFGPTPDGNNLNTTSWASISTISAAGLAPNYWAVGDTKAVNLNGTIGNLSVNATYYVYIIGFNHNGANNTIDFGTFKTAQSGGLDVCLVDSKYGNSSASTSRFNMNSSDTNSGGWKSSVMRYYILGSTDTNAGDATSTTATSPRWGTLMYVLPSDLRAVMKPMTIYTDNTGRSSSSTASYVTATVDYLPLLAEFEVLGKTSYANTYEQNYQKQY